MKLNAILLAVALLAMPFTCEATIAFHAGDKWEFGSFWDEYRTDRGDRDDDGFVQFDFSKAGYAAGLFHIDRVHRDSEWELWGSNEKGVLGTRLYENSKHSGDVEWVLSIPSFTSYRYFSWISRNSDLSLGKSDSTGSTVSSLKDTSILAATGVPEPGTFLLAGLAMAGVALIHGRRRMQTR